MHETRSRSLNRPETKRKREDSEGRVRSSSKVPRDQSGVRDVAMAKAARKITKTGQRKMNLSGRKGEADRHVSVAKPKHLCKSHRVHIDHSDDLSLASSFRQTIIRQNRSAIGFVLFLALLSSSELK